MDYKGSWSDPGKLLYFCHIARALEEMRLRAQHVIREYGGRPHLQNSKLAAWSQWASRVAAGTSTMRRAVVSPHGILASDLRAMGACLLKPSFYAS